MAQMLKDEERVLVQSELVHFTDVIEDQNLEDLRRLTGLSRHTIYRLRDGVVKPQHRTRRVLAQALGVRPDEIAFPADISKDREMSR